MKTKVLLKLKPKAQSLGFNDEELLTAAETISGSLAQDATDEQIDAEVDKFLPLLQVSQRMATRVINKAKPEPSKKEDKPKPGVDDDQEQMPPWFKKYQDEQDAKIQKILDRDTTKNRTTLFEAKLEGLLPKQKEAMLKDFERMSFKDDDDFNAYLTDKSVIVAEINQELADKGLEKMSKPGGGGNAKTEEDEFVKSMEEMNKKD